MPITTQRDIFDKYEYGNNLHYRTEYQTYDSSFNNDEGCCFGVVYSFIYEVMEGKEIDFYSRGANLAKWLSMAVKYHKIALKTKIPSCYIMDQMDYWMKKYSASFYQRGRQSAVVLADDPQRIISKIQKYPDRFPIGYLEIYSHDRTLVHATAFASDRTNIYYFDPNYGFMKVDRKDVQQLRDIFIESYRPDYCFRHSFIAYAKRRAVIQEPVLRLC